MKYQLTADVAFRYVSSDQSQVQVHRDRVLAEGRREVGIWSSYGVQVWM